MRRLLPLVLALAGCATAPPPRPPEVRIPTQTVYVPTPVPCFTEDQRPRLPMPTPINPETATTEQLAAAELADSLALLDYSERVDKLFLLCIGAVPK